MLCPSTISPNRGPFLCCLCFKVLIAIQPEVWDTQGGKMPCTLTSEYMKRCIWTSHISKSFMRGKIHYGCIKALHNWSEYILNAFDVPYSNGFTEGCNNKTKVLKRVCFGVSCFSTFRNRILHCASASWCMYIAFLLVMLNCSWLPLLLFRRVWHATHAMFWTFSFLFYPNYWCRAHYFCLSEDGDWPKRALYARKKDE